MPSKKKESLSIDKVLGLAHQVLVIVQKVKYLVEEVILHIGDLEL